MPKTEQKNNIYTSKWEHCICWADVVWPLNCTACRYSGIEDDPEILTLPQCGDEPCILWPGKDIHTYFVESKSPNEYQPLSKTINRCYSCMYHVLNPFYYRNRCLDALVILISNKIIVAGKFESGHMAHSLECDFSSKSENSTETVQLLLNLYLKKWQTDFGCSVIVRCSEEYKKSITELFEACEFKSHVPFKTAKPSIEELKRVFEKLSSVQSFQSVNLALKDLEAKRKGKILKTDQSKELRANVSKAQLRSQRQNWPDINKKTQTALLKALENGDEDEIFALAHGVQHHEQIQRFLNALHLDLDDETCLHFATRRNFKNVVQVLLDLGCDPTLTNSEGAVPYELCNNSSIQAVYIDYRNRNPNSHNWNRAKIPKESTSLRKCEKEEDLEYRTPKHRKSNMRCSKKSDFVQEY